MLSLEDMTGDALVRLVPSTVLTKKTSQTPDFKYRFELATVKCCEEEAVRHLSAISWVGEHVMNRKNATVLDA